MSFLNKKAIRDYCKQRDRRAGKAFIEIMERVIERHLKNACEAHNGGKVTLDETVAGYIGLRAKSIPEKDK